MLLELPLEIQKYIASRLDFPELFMLAQLSKQLRKIAIEEILRRNPQTAWRFQHKWLRAHSKLLLSSTSELRETQFTIALQRSQVRYSKKMISEGYVALLSSLILRQDSKMALDAKTRLTESKKVALQNAIISASSYKEAWDDVITALLITYDIEIIKKFIQTLKEKAKHQDVARSTSVANFLPAVTSILNEADIEEFIEIFASKLGVRAIRKNASETVCFLMEFLQKETIRKYVLIWEKQLQHGDINQRYKPLLMLNAHAISQVSEISQAKMISILVSNLHAGSWEVAELSAAALGRLSCFIPPEELPKIVSTLLGIADHVFLSSNSVYKTLATLYPRVDENSQKNIIRLFKNKVQSIDDEARVQACSWFISIAPYISKGDYLRVIIDLSRNVNEEGYMPSTLKKAITVLASHADSAELSNLLSNEIQELVIHQTGDTRKTLERLCMFSACKNFISNDNMIVLLFDKIVNALSSVNDEALICCLAETLIEFVGFAPPSRVRSIATVIGNRITDENVVLTVRIQLFHPFAVYLLRSSEKNASEFVTIVFQMLQHPDIFLQEKAAETLARYAKYLPEIYVSGTVARFKNILDHGVSIMRVYAIEGLEALVPRMDAFIDFLDYLVSKLNEQNPEIFRIIIRILNNHLGGLLPEQAGKTIDAIKAFLLKRDIKPEIRTFCQEALIHIGFFTPEQMPNIIPAVSLKLFDFNPLIDLFLTDSKIDYFHNESYRSEVQIRKALITKGYPGFSFDKAIEAKKLLLDIQKTNNLRAKNNPFLLLAYKIHQGFLWHLNLSIETAVKSNTLAAWFIAATDLINYCKNKKGESFQTLYTQLSSILNKEQIKLDEVSHSKCK